MRELRYSVLALSLAIALTASAWPDTIMRTNAEGQSSVVQSNAIVIDQNQYTIAYKHFDLKRRRVLEVHLNQGSLPYKAVLSSAAERQQIVKVWNEFGYTASVEVDGGKVTQVYDCYLDFFPPSGVGTFIQTVPALTSLPIMEDNGAADEIEFSDIASIINTKGHFKVTLTNGRVETGKFLMPTSQPAIAHFMGITDRYSPASSQVYDFSVPLANIKQIHFENN